MGALSPIEVERLDTTSARLPAAYEAAKNALANCASLDECQTWANKAQALASYARQADDDALERQAVRIRSRAIRRCGELLKDFSSAGGRPASNDDETRKPDLTSFPATQREAAGQAGMSLHQERTAIRVANVPQEAFEAVIESDAPPTISALAEIGKQDAAPRGVHPSFHAANIQLMGFARRLEEFCEKHLPSEIAPALESYNQRELRRCTARIRRWLKELAPLVREA